jgi:ABC-type transporter Mla subunit MlaD
MAVGDRDVRLKVVIDEDGRGADKAANDLDRIDKSAGKADDSLDKLGKTTKRVNADIDKHRESIRRLAEEYEKTGNVDLFKNIRKDQSAIRNLEKIKAALSDVEKEGLKLADVFTDASGVIGKGLEKVAESPELLAAGGVIAAGLASAIAAELAGAALVATAGAGLAAGIALAARSPEVQSAWSGFGHDALDELTKAASTFEAPLIKAAGTFRTALGDVMPSIRADFAVLAPLVDVLAKSAAQFVKNLQPGLTEAFKGAVPVVREVAAELPKVGDAISDMLKDLGKAGPGGADALVDTLKALEVSTRVLGTAMRDGAVLFELFGGGALVAASKVANLDAVIQSLTSSPLVTLLMALGLVKDESDKAAGKTLNLDTAMQLLHQDSKSAAGAIDSVATAADGLFNQIMGVDQTTLKWKEDLRQITDQIKEHGLSLRDNTEAGQSNQRMIQGLVQDNEDIYNANIKAKMSVEDASKIYHKNTDELKANLIHLGYDKDKVGELIDKYDRIPRGPIVTPIDANVNQAFEKIASVNRSLNALHDRITTTTVIVNTETGETRKTVHAGPRFEEKGGVVAAATGLITSSPTIMFGERRTVKEAFIPMRGVSDSRGLQLADEAASWHGGMVVPKGSAMGGGAAVVQLEWVGGNATDEFFTFLRKNIRLRGGLTTALDN